MIEANNPNLKTWLEVTQSSDFQYKISLSE